MSKENIDYGGTGGRICNHMGGGIVGYYIRLGVCSAIVAELQGFIYGLSYVLEQGFCQVEVNVDSQLVLDLLSQEVILNYQF